LRDIPRRHGGGVNINMKRASAWLVIKLERRRRYLFK
jgi:hypothetical protein